MFRILLFISVFVLVSSISAQTDSFQVDVEEITISDRRMEIGYSEVSRSIKVIHESEINVIPAQNVAELLQYVAGVDVRRRGIHGVQSDVSLRGGGFDQTLVLINGINVSDAQTGHHLMNIPINVEDIERIEILQGPGARVYGQNAFSGAINIITKKRKQPSLQFNGSYSQNVTGRIGIMASLPTDKGSHQLSYTKSFSEGYRHNTDYEIDNFWYQSQFDVGENELSIMAGLSDRAFGANGFYASPDFTEQYEEIGTSLLSARYTIRSGKWKIAPALFWRRNQDEYIFVRSNPSIYRNLHIGNTYGAEVNTSRVNNLGILGIGIDLRIDDLQSNNLGERTRTTMGFNVEQRMSFLDGSVDVTPGIAAFHYSDFGSRLFPGLDLGVRLTEMIKLYGNIGSTWRVPTYTDLFYEDPANLGNPELEPETALTTELGVKFQDKVWDIQLSGFRRNSQNLIDWTKADADDQWFPSNVGEVNIQGIDFQGNLRFASGIFSRLGIGYTHLDGENMVDAPISRYALEYLRHHLIISTDLNLTEDIQVGLFGKYVDRLTLDSYTVIDGKIHFQLDNIRLSLFANNLLDRMYTETSLVPMPGRWLGIEIRYTAL